MNILDENILKSQRQFLHSWGIRIRQIGVDVGRCGMQDEEIIVLLHQRRRSTFFTRDDDFYHRKLCHPHYCLAYLAVDKAEASIFVRRFLRHPEFNTQVKRMGTVVRISRAGLSVWHLQAEQAASLKWTK